MATRDPNQARTDGTQQPQAQQPADANANPNPTGTFSRNDQPDQKRRIGDREVTQARGTPTSTPQTPPRDVGNDPVLSGQGSVNTSGATAGGVATLQPVPGTGNATMVGAPGGATGGATGAPTGAAPGAPSGGPAGGAPGPAAGAPTGGTNAAPGGAMTTGNTGGIAGAPIGS